METVVEEIITGKTIGPAFQRAVYQTGWVTARALEIQQELARVSSKKERIVLMEKLQFRLPE